MKRIFTFIIVLAFFLPSCKAEQKYRIIDDFLNDQVLIENEFGNTVCKLSNKDALINNEIKIINDNLYYIDIDYRFISVNLKTKKKELLLSDIGTFCFSDDGNYLCAGKIVSENNRFYVTCEPEIYFTKKLNRITEAKGDYSFLKNEDGINTYIEYVPSKKVFEVSYMWDTAVPKFKVEISLETKEVKRIK